MCDIATKHVNKRSQLHLLYRRNSEIATQILFPFIAGLRLRFRINLRRIRFTLFTLMRIRIRFFTLLFIRILVLIKVMGICDHWSSYGPCTAPF